MSLFFGTRGSESLANAIAAVIPSPGSVPAYVQGVAAPTPASDSSPVVFTWATMPAVGNIVMAIIAYNDSFEDHDYLPPDATWTVALGGRNGASGGGPNRVLICTHLVTPSDGLVNTFYPTPGTNGDIGAFLFETTGSVSAQVAFAAGAASSNAQVTASLTPALANSLVIAGVYGVYPAALPAGSTAVAASPFNPFVQLTAPTADATTTVSLTFPNYAPAIAVSWLIVFAPGTAAAAPTASPAPGAYDATQLTQSITLTSATSGAVIHYTLDGTLPRAPRRSTPHRSLSTAPPSSTHWPSPLASAPPALPHTTAWWRRVPCSAWDSTATGMATRSSPTTCGISL